MAQLCLQRDRDNDPGAMWVESLSQHTAIKGSSLCLEDSHQVIDLIYKYLDIDTVTGPLPSWWYCVLCAYSPTFSLSVLPNFSQLSTRPRQSFWSNDCSQSSQRALLNTRLTFHGDVLLRSSLHMPGSAIQQRGV